MGRVVLTDGAENLREQVERRYTPRRPPPLLETEASAPDGAPEPLAPRPRILELAPGESREVVFTLGAADTVDEARRLFRQFGGPAGARTALESVWEHWNRLPGVVQVDLPGEVMGQSPGV